MSKDRWRFTASEIKRAVTAVAGTGLTISNVEVGRDGKITVTIARTPGSPDPAEVGSSV